MMWEVIEKMQLYVDPKHTMPHFALNRYVKGCNYNGANLQIFDDPITLEKGDVVFYETKDWFKHAIIGEKNDDGLLTIQYIGSDWRQESEDTAPVDEITFGDDIDKDVYVIHWAYQE